MAPDVTVIRFDCAVNDRQFLSALNSECAGRCLGCESVVRVKSRSRSSQHTAQGKYALSRAHNNTLVEIDTLLTLWLFPLLSRVSIV
jgi:hypothetical protein